MGIDYSVNVFVGIEVDPNKMPEDEDTFEDLDVVRQYDEQRCFLAADNCVGLGLKYSDSLCKMANFPDRKEEMRAFLEPLGMWDESKYGVWIIGQVG
jgi:hypothetical protein